MLYQIVRALENTLKPVLLFRSSNHRRTHIYCVGTAKSGTHSIAAVFGNNLRSKHEPDSRELISLILDSASSHINDEDLRNYLYKRDQKLQLDVDSSQLNFFLLKHFIALFDDAKFILTIRNPYTWLDSFINHQLAHQCNEKWEQLRNFRFHPNLHTHPDEELILKENGLYTLDGYLSYWAYHNQTVIDTVPSNRLLIIRTDKIDESLEKIADFTNVSTDVLNEKQSHSFSAKKKFHLLNQIDREYLELKVNQYCSSLISEFFPDITSTTINHLLSPNK